MGQQESNGELLFQQVSHNDIEAIKSLHHEDAELDVATPLHHAASRGLEDTVKLLLSYGANPLALNDDSKTPLKVARAKGHSNVVRAIESHICLFSGWMREFYGPSFAPQLLSRRVWVVIVPTGSRNPAKPLKLELVVYASLQDAQPRMEMQLWKANLEESKSDQSDASVMIVDNSTSSRHKRQRTRRGYISHARRWAQVDRQTRLKLAAENKGDMQQLNWFTEACKGIPQPMNPPMFLKTSQTTTTGNIISNELTPLGAVKALEEGYVHYPSVDFAHGDFSISSANGENREDGGGGFGVCVICVDASCEAACVPCGHVAGCVSCLKKIKNKKMGCPVCRTNIDQVIKLYHV